MNEQKVAVVILNYNGKHLLEAYLPGVVRHSFPYAVYVADNASSDDSLSYVESNFPDVRIIRNEGNYGYSKGYNVALKHIDAEYFVLLNNDVEVTEGWIDKVMTMLDLDPWIAACQPRLLDLNKLNQFEYAGAAGGFIDKYGYPFCRGRIFNTLEADTGQYTDEREIFWASGACLFVKSAAYWQAGALDEHYFAHMEEIDLCWRFRNLGYKVCVQPDSIVYHLGGGTLKKISSRKTFLNFRNNLSTLVRNHPPRFIVIKLLFRLVLDALAATKFLFEGQPRHLLAVLVAHFQFYWWLPRLIMERRELSRKPGFRYNTTCVYDGNIVWEYYLRNKTRFTDLTRGFFTE